MATALSRRLVAECIGTMWLVLGGCGAAVLAAAFPQLGIGFVGVALAFGLTLLTMCYAIGPISGCHINPAVTVGLWAARRFPLKEVGPYVVAQLVGGVLGAGILFLIAGGKAGFDVHAGFASNGFGDHSPGGFSMLACAVCEIVTTCFFILIITLSTDRPEASGFAGIAIGLSLTLIHLISIPVTNTSVNPARSLRTGNFCRRLGDRPSVVFHPHAGRRRYSRRTYLPVSQFDGAVGSSGMRRRISFL